MVLHNGSRPKHIIIFTSHPSDSWYIKQPCNVSWHIHVTWAGDIQRSVLNVLADNGRVSVIQTVTVPKVDQKYDTIFIYCNWVSTLWQCTQKVKTSNIHKEKQ